MEVHPRNDGKQETVLCDLHTTTHRHRPLYDRLNFGGPERNAGSQFQYAGTSFSQCTHWSPRLPEPFLQSIGVSDNHEKPGEVLVHYHQANNELAKVHRIRTALTATEGDRWTQDQIGPIVPYGLGRLSDENQGYLVLVNGEADCWTLWRHGFPALGVPGAKMIPNLEAEHLPSVPKIYVVKEPNKAGGAFVASVAKRLQELAWTGNAFIVCMPKGIKDANELHRRDSAAFATKFQTLLDAADPLPPPEPFDNFSVLGA